MFHQGRAKDTANPNRVKPYQGSKPNNISDDDLVEPLAELLPKHKDVVLRKMATFLSLLQTETPEEAKTE